MIRKQGQRTMDPAPSGSLHNNSRNSSTVNSAWRRMLPRDGYAEVSHRPHVGPETPTPPGDREASGTVRGLGPLRRWVAVYWTTAVSSACVSVLAAALPLPSEWPLPLPPRVTRLPLPPVAALMASIEPICTTLV